MDSEQIHIRTGGGVFVYRVAGIARDGDRVLLHRMDGDEIWALPGGRARMGETAAEALAREMSEELGADVAVGKVMWLVENFFEGHLYDDAGIPHHEIGVYMAMTLPDEFYADDSFRGEEVTARGEIGLEFRWFDTGSLGKVDLRPRILRLVLAGDPPEGFRTLVQQP